jgi:hypothetical protein
MNRSIQRKLRRIQAGQTGCLDFGLISILNGYPEVQTTLERTIVEPMLERRSLAIAMMSFLMILFALVSDLHAAPVHLRHLLVDTSKVATEEQLARQADLIVVGRYGPPVQTVSTGRRAGGGMLTNYVQPFQIAQTIKGQAGRTIRIVSTGINPLPPAGDSIQERYPGPMEDGRYVCFLKQITGSNLYYLIGGWQGVYPIDRNRLVALRNAGFPSFDGLTVDAARSKIRSLLQ